MWSFFSSDPAKNFNYELLDRVDGLVDKSVWRLHKGKKKATGDPVSVFVFEVKGSSDAQVQIAKAAFKRIKTLRHPNILTYIDGLESDKVIYIVTEPVTPLETYLRDNKQSSTQNELAISWGLHQITDDGQHYSVRKPGRAQGKPMTISRLLTDLPTYSRRGSQHELDLKLVMRKGLSFLVNDCKLIHNNVCMSSIFVDQAGEWKLGGVDYMFPAQGPDSYPPVKILPALERYDPPEKTEPRGGPKGGPWSADMWGLGCLIWEVFNGSLPGTSSLKSLGKVPKNLVPNYCELVGANPKSRPNPAKFIESCRKKGGFMCNSFVDTMLFMEEIQIKDQTEKNKFFNSLTPSLDSFPSAMCKHKILPQLINAFEYGNAGSAVLAPLFKVGKLLDTEEYQKRVVPCVIKLFTSPDRATRVKLLQQIEFFIEHLQPDTVNSQIFPHVVQGFMDTNPVVREHTIKAMLHMASKLNYKNLNEELMKHFARLQSKDDQGGIRTNTTVCLGKIAGYLYPQIRQKLLLSAFMRAVRDPFPPARQAGILGMAATQNYYLLADIASKLLPTLCSLTMDPEQSVREQAFKAIKGFLGKLEKASENPDLIAEMEKDVHTGGSSTMGGSSSWAGWAVSGMSSLTSKLYKKGSSPKSRGGIGEIPKPKSPPKADQSLSSKTLTAAPSGDQEEDQEEETVIGQEEDQAGDGWDDEDWGNMDDFDSSVAGETSEKPEQSNDGWDEEDWGSLEDTASSDHLSAGNSAMKSGEEGQSSDWNSWGQEDFTSTADTGLPCTSAYNWGQSEDTDTDFFSQALKPAKKASKIGTTKPQSTSQYNRQKTPPRQSSSSSGYTPGGQGVKTTADGGQESGWGSSGWGDSDDWGTTDTDNSDAARKRREREEKKLQRQKEMQEKREARKTGGALKLGAKKMNQA